MLATGLYSNDRYRGQRTVESQRSQKFREACRIENSITLEARRVCQSQRWEQVNVRNEIS